MLNVSQCAALIARIGNHFPFWYRTLTPAAIAELAEDWAAILGDVDERAVVATIRKLLSEKREFPPTAGEVNAEVRRQIAIGGGEREYGAGEAWQAVCAAVTSEGLGAVWDKVRKAELPATAIQAAEAMGLVRIRMRLTANEGTDFAQFRASYETACAREREARTLAPAVRDLFAQVATSLKMAQLPPGRPDSREMVESSEDGEE